VKRSGQKKTKPGVKKDNTGLNISFSEYRIGIIFAVFISYFLQITKGLSQ